MNAIWYDKDSKDPGRPWLVRLEGGRVVRARAVHLRGVGCTAFSPEGFAQYQPASPRGVVLCTAVQLDDEIDVGS